MKSTFKNRYMAMAALAATTSLASALPGNLDTSFNTQGFATANFGSTETGTAVAVTPDGKVVVAGTTNVFGNSDVAVLRYNSNGTLDSSFSGDGGVITDIGAASIDNVTGVAVQPDGKIVVVGYTNANAGAVDVLLVRYLKDGSLDPSFGANGKVIKNYFQTDQPSAVAIQPDGKIVVAGTEGVGSSGTGCDFSVSRFLGNGTPDPEFNGGGRRFVEFGGVDFGKAVALQADGKIVVAGYTGTAPNIDYAVARINADGTIDTTFSSDGKVTLSHGANDQATGVAIQRDGKIVVAGSRDGGSADFAISRLLSNGSLDTTFAGDGTANFQFGTSVDFAKGIALQKNGKIVVAGVTNASDPFRDFAIARLTTLGELDTSFGNSGKVTTNFGTGSTDLLAGIAIQKDGRLVAAGTSKNDFAIARYNMIYQADTLVGFNNKTTAGGNVYNASGASQTINTKIKKKGGKKNLYIRAQNDSNETAALHVKGTAGTGVFQIRYFSGKKNITNAVKAGTYKTGNLSPNGSALIRVEVIAKTKSANKTRNIFVTTKPVPDGAAADTVLIKAKSF